MTQLPAGEVNAQLNLNVSFRDAISYLMHSFLSISSFSVESTILGACQLLLVTNKLREFNVVLIEILQVLQQK